MPRADEMGKKLRDELSGLRAVAHSGTTSNVMAERLLESVFLNAVTEFEAFLEDLFFAAVCRKVRPGATKPVIGLQDERTARQIVIRPNERYATWLPIEDSIRRAEQYLIDGMPFARLARRQTVRDSLGKAVIIRNAVAHKSEHAQHRFTTTFGSRYSSPGHYLRALSGSGTACDAVLEDLARYGEALCGSDATADALLGAEDLLPTGKKVEAGRYECDLCGNVYVLHVRGKLHCPQCDPPCSACGHTTTSNATFRSV